MQSSASERLTTLGRFEIRGELGSGGAGVVYEAWDTERETSVALKILRKLTGNSLYRFKREFRSLQGIRHQNLIRLGELFVEDDVWFFTMELISGGQTLREYLDLPNRIYSGQENSETTVTVMSKAEMGDTLAPLPGSGVELERPPSGKYELNEARLRDALPQLARVIQALHRADRIHGDIKPTNVLVGEGGRMVLTDFGLVQERTPRASAMTEFAGTPAYMAPEQAGGDPGPAADWYAFGSVLYHALTGRLPYYANHPYQLLEKKQRFAPAPPRAVAPGVPEDLDRLCEDLLRVDPNRRPRGPEVLERLGVASSHDLGLVDHHHTMTQTAPFVGRASEMVVLEKAYRHVADKQAPSTVIVEGESGVGKSELVRQFLGALRDDPASPVVLESRCYERETVPFKAFDGIIDSLSRFMIELSDADAAVLLPRKAGLLPRLFPVLGRVECIATSPVEAATAEPREQRKRMFSALRELVERVAERHRLVLVIDDFQWADSESLALLGEILHPSQPLPLMLILTSRLDSQLTVGSQPDLDLVVGGRFERLSVGSLTTEQARELLALTGARIQDPDALIEEAQGHPLFLVELARHAALVEGKPGGDRTMRLDDALWSRTRELEPNARRLLELLAVAGTPVSNAVAARALDEDYSDFEQASALLRAASLARSNAARGTDSLETYHDRVRTAVSSRLADADRKRCHTRLAIAMETEKDSSDPRALVRHLEQSGQLEKAARRAAEAGKAASETFAFEQAAALFGTAVRLGQWSEDKARELMMLRGHALINAGLGSEAADVFLRAADGADPATRLECRRHAAEQLLICGRIEPGLEAMSDLLAEVGAKLRKSQAKSLAALLWNRLCLRVRGLGWKSRHIREIADADLMRLEVYKAVAHGLGTVDSIVGFEFQARGLRLALKLGEKTRVARALAIEAIYLATQSKAGRARAEILYKEARRIAQETQDPYLLGTCSVVRGCIEYFGGNFPSAIGPLRDGEALLRDVPGAVWELNGARMFLVFALRIMGRVSELGPHYDENTRDADRRGDLHAGTTLRRAASVVWLARDDVEGARKALAHASWMPDTDVFHLQHWFELEAHTDIALYEQTLERHRDDLLIKFDALEKSLLRRVQTVRTTARWLRARVALTDASEGRDVAASLALAEKLAKSLAGEKIGYASVWSLMLRAGIATQKNKLDQARSLLGDAIDLADANSMTSCGAAARLRLAALLGDDRGASLDDQGRDAFAAENFVNPDQILRVIAPGCAPPKPMLES